MVKDHKTEQDGEMMKKYKVKESRECVKEMIFDSYSLALKWVTDFLENEDDKSYSFEILEVIEE